MHKKDTPCKCHGLEDQISKLNEEIAKLKEQAENYKQSWQRERADLINFKKEESERLTSLKQYLLTSLVEKFLPALDAFDLAKKHIPEDKAKDQNIIGLLMTGKMLLDILEGLDVHQISYLGKIYDPIECEVIEEKEVSNGQTGEVIEELQKGYKTKDKLLRPNKVIIIK